MGILVSQLAGGVLAILIIPLLHFVAPSGPWVTIAAALLFGFGLVMPIAFAAGVWKFHVLDLDINDLPPIRAVSTSS
jgi:membrane protein YdbS with pleckstrin-like domain